MYNLIQVTKHTLSERALSLKVKAPYNLFSRCTNLEIGEMLQKWSSLSLVSSDVKRIPLKYSDLRQLCVVSNVASGLIIVDVSVRISLLLFSKYSLAIHCACCSQINATLSNTRCHVWLEG